MALRRRISTIGLLAFSVLATATGPVHSQELDFRIQSYYGLEFDGTKIGLLAVVGVQNTSRADLRDVVVRFSPAEPFKIDLGPDELRHRNLDTQEFADRLEDGGYVYERSFLGKGQTLTMFYRLKQKKMLREANRLLVFPKVEVSYTVDHPGDQEEDRRTYAAPYTDEYRLPWDSFQGTVDSFLSRYADISVRLTKCLPDRTIRFMKPVGVRHDALVIGVEGSSDSDGFFRMQTGFPGSKDRVGNLQEILGFWKIQDKDEKPGPAMLLEALEGTVNWLGSAQDFNFVVEGEPEEVKVLRERGWAVSGSWHNPQENRLGKGRFRLYTFDVTRLLARDRVKQTWFLLLRTQANSSGSTSDQPDAAAAAAAETALLEELIGCFEQR